MKKFLERLSARSRLKAGVLPTLLNIQSMRTAKIDPRPRLLVLVPQKGNAIKSDELQVRSAGPKRTVALLINFHPQFETGE